MFWLTYDTPRGTEVFIAEAAHLLMARMKAGLAGQQGEFQEGHQLDAEMAKNIPAQMIGRTLSQKEAIASQADCLMPLVYRERGPWAPAASAPTIDRRVGRLDHARQERPSLTTPASKESRSVALPVGLLVANDEW